MYHGFRQDGPLTFFAFGAERRSAVVFVFHRGRLPALDGDVVDVVPAFFPVVAVEAGVFPDRSNADGIVALGWLESKLQRPRRFVYFHVTAHREPGVIDAVNDLAEDHNLQLDSIALERREDRMEMEFSLTCTAHVRDEIIEELLELEAVDEVRVNE